MNLFIRSEHGDYVALVADRQSSVSGGTKTAASCHFVTDGPCDYSSGQMKGKEQQQKNKKK